MFILAYFGPETILPVTSVLAAVAGVFLMGGRQAIRFAGLALRTLGRSVGIGPKPPAKPIARPAGRRVRREHADAVER